jgi:hypothetical protein
MTRPVELEDGTEDPRYLEYDGDRQDASQYCEHGKFIGSWWGPDILCGYCESGISVEDLLMGELEQAEKKLRDFTKLVIGDGSSGPNLNRSLGGIDWGSELGQALGKTFGEMASNITALKNAVETDKWKKGE